MSGGGGGFRGRGFSLHGHHRQGPNGPGGPITRPIGSDGRSGISGMSRNEDPSSRVNLLGVGRPNDNAPRCLGPNSRPDGPNARMGGTNFRGGTGTPHGPRPNFNLARRPPRHPLRPSENWVPRGGGSPHYANWRGGRPPRFNGSPRPYYRGRGNNFNNYRFPYMGNNNMGSIGMDYPPVPEPKPAIPHLGSEEERLQKITEAADELKRKLSAGPNETDVWYNDNEDDAAMDSASEEYESRIANKGIPELKHDPPELNLTLSDLRDIGRVDHDRGNEQTKTCAENASDSYEDTEVEILDYNPVETMIEIDIWSDDNYVEHEDGESSSNRPNERSSTVTESTETSSNTIPNTIRDKSAMRDTLDTEENASQTGIRNEDNLERTNQEKFSVESVREAENERGKDCEIVRLEEKRDGIRVKVEKITETFNEIIRDVPVEHNSIINEKSRNETQEDNTERLSEDSINCTRTEQQNKIETIDDKKIEDVRIKLEYVNKNATLSGSSEKFVSVGNESQREKINRFRDESGSAAPRSGLTDELLNGLKSTKPTTRSKNDGSALNEEPDKSETPIVAKKTKASREQTNNENPEDTTKSVAGVADETEIRKDGAPLNSLWGALNATRSEKTSLRSSDHENSQAQLWQDEITKKSRCASLSDETQVRKETTIDSRNEENREDSRKEVEDKDIRGRTEQSIDVYSRSEKLSNKTNSNGKTEAREKTEIPRKVDTTRDTQTDKKIIDKHKSESSSGRDKTFFDDNESSTSDNKPSERRKLVRKMPVGSEGPRNRKSSLAESIAKLQRSMAAMKEESCEQTPVVFDPRGPPPTRPYPTNNYRNSAPIIQEPSLNHQPPVAFDPRLSTQERTALLASGARAPASIPITQDYGMNPRYPSCPMTNFVPNVAPMNYGAPAMIGGPVDSPICLADPFAPMLTMASMPTTIPLPAEAMMLQPPLPIEPPPPPPPPAKSSLDMVDELEDMQEAMEFAKTFMNMGGVGNIAGDSMDSGFFHMPTFPNLPPIELPPLPPPEIPPPSAIPPPLDIPPPPMISVKTAFSNRRTVLNKEYEKGIEHIKREPIEAKSIPDESRHNSSPNTAISSKREAWSQQQQVYRHYADEGKSKNHPSTLPIDAAMVATAKENTRFTNGHENRETTRTDGNSSSLNGTPCLSHLRKPDDASTNRLRSRSASPSKRDKNSKDDESRSTPTYKEKSEQSLRRGVKDSTAKRITDTPRTPESSWKNRVIGRFLKMSKNDICNMLNNTGLRKFDIAMNQLVKERRSSLSLGMRNNEEEKMKGADVSYDREEFMDQLNAMLDPSATVDVCNLPTTFIHHLSEVLQLDSMSDFEVALTPTDTTEIVPSPTPVQSSPYVCRVPRAPSANAKEIDDRRPTKRGRDKKTTSTCDSAIEAATIGTTTATPSPISATPVARKLSTRTRDDIVETRCAKNVESIVAETSINRVTPVAVGRRRRRSQPTSVEAQDTMTVNNGSASRIETSSLNMTDLDDIFSPGIVRERKKLSSIVATATNEPRTADFHLSSNTGNNEVARDPSMDRVERAAVELDKIFTAGIARFKLPSIKAASAASRAAEANNDDDEYGDEDGNWNRDVRKSNLDSRRARQRSICRFGTRSDKWSNRKTCEDRDAFRNLTKEEWEAKYGESSYASYEQEYRAMVATRERRHDYEFTTESEDNTGVKSRLGDAIPADSCSHEAWSDTDIAARFRNVHDSANYEINDYRRNSSDSSLSSSMSTSSDSSDDEPEAESVHKLLREIKAKEKIAKTKSLNEEIRDEVAAEIEKKRQEREKLRRSRHKARQKKSHRRRKDRRERRRRERKRRKHKSRRSGTDSRGSSDSDYTDEEYTSSASHGRRSSRLLTENEIKKEVVVKDEPEAMSPTHPQKRSNSSLAIRLHDEARPSSRSSVSSLPAVAITSTTVPSAAASQPKTKAQLKQMPAANKNVVAATVVSNEIVKTQDIPANEARETACKDLAVTSLTDEGSRVIGEPDKSATTASISSVNAQPISNTTDETLSSTRPNSKKLDIKAYKERNRLRQIRETEAFRQMTENPSALTQNLLNASLVRKDFTETTEDIVNSIEREKQARLDRVEESKNATIATATSNTVMLIEPTSNLTAICTTNPPTIVSSSTAPPTIVSTTSPPTVVSATTSPVTVVPTTTGPLAVISTTAGPPTVVSTTTSPLTIISTPASTRTTASSSLNLQKIVSAATPASVSSAAEAAKVSASESIESQLVPSKKVSPKKLVRRRSLTSAPMISVDSTTAESRAEAGKFAHIKSEGRKEMKLREKLKKHRPRPSAKGLECTIPPAKPARVRKRSSVSSGTTTDDGAASSSEKCAEIPATLLSQKAEEEQAPVASIEDTEKQDSGSSEKITAEQDGTHSENIATEEATVPSQKITSKPVTVFEEKVTEDETTATSKKMTAEEAKVPSEKIPEEIIDTEEKCVEKQAMVFAENCKEETTLIASETRTEKQTIDPSEKVTEETTNVGKEKHAEESMAVASDNSTEESVVIIAKISTEEPMVLDSNNEAQAVLSPTENIAKESAVMATDNLDKSTEEPTRICEAIKSTSMKFDLFKAGLRSDALPDTVPQEYLSTMHIARKHERVVDSQSELEPFDSPIGDMPEWPLESTISSDPNVQVNDSNDEPPFRGFAKDSIILHDRVLTEAEGNITELNDLSKVPLSFANDESDESGDGVLNLDEVTSTGVSLDAPMSYGDEEFVEGGVEIETSLLGFPVANDISDMPETNVLGADNDIVDREDASTEKSFPEESSRESADLITRLTPTLNDSPVPNDFLITNVRSQETVPSAILVTEPIRDEPSESPNLSPKDKVDEKHSKENTDLPRDDAAEVSASSGSENKETPGTTVVEITPLGAKMGLLHSTDAGEKEIYHQMGRVKNISEHRENQPTKSITTEERNSQEISATDSSRKNTPVDSAPTQSQREQFSDVTNIETAERIRTDDGTRVVDAKTKESNRSSKTTTKEHSHSRNKRKSNRHHNQVPRSEKKSAITEKMVEEAISANIVKVVPKPPSKESVLARMIEIDVEIHKLMNEKMTLYTMLRSGEFTAKDNHDVVSDNKTNDEAKLPSEREEAAIPDIAPTTVLASHLARNLDKTALIAPTRSHETKKTNSANDEKAKRRKKSPQRGIKHRGEESGETIEKRRERENSESKSHSRRKTSEEPSNRETASRIACETSNSSTELDDADDNRRGRKTKPLDSSKRQATRRSRENSSKEDVGEASRESTDGSGKSSKRESSPKSEKSKKRNSKAQSEPRKIEELSNIRKTEEKSNAIVTKQTEKIGSVIYSDESTWDSLDPDATQSDEQRGKKDGTTGSCTGLALLEETFKREIAQTKKGKAVEKRKSKKQELRRVILDASTFLTAEAEMAASDSHDRKNIRKKGSVASPANKGKSGGASSEDPAKVREHIASVIDAVAADRVEQLYTQGSSPISNDSTPTTSTSGRSVESELARERSPSISLTESMGSEKYESDKKVKKEESRMSQKQDTDSKESGNDEPVEPTKSKASKKSKANEKNYLSESKESESSGTTYGSERSSPIEYPRKARDVDTSSVDNTSKTPDVDASTRTSAKTRPEVNVIAVKQENAKISTSADGFPRKNDSRSSKEKESEARIADDSRSPSPDLPNAPSRSKSHEAKSRTKEKPKSEILIVKAESMIEVSPGENELGRSSRETEDERARSHSRNERPSKGRSITPRDRDRERREKNSSRTEESNDHDDKSSSRSKSASKRRQRDKSLSSNRRNSRYSEDRSKRSGSKKRERERSESRGRSSHDSESSRKRFHHSHRSSSPQVQSTLNDEHARRRGRKRKRRPEMSLDDMMNCKVQLIDCKYTYLSPEMRPRVLKKFGISRINPYVPPTLRAESSPTPEFVGDETPSPPTLCKVETMKEVVEESSSPKEIQDPEEANDRRDVDEARVDVVTEDEDGTDETIHIVKVVENAQNSVISDQEEDADVTEIIDDTSCPTDTAAPDVIAVEDETTDENEAKNDTTDEIVVVGEKVSRTEKTIEKEQTSEILEAEEEITRETRRTRYTVHKGPILDIKVLDDSFLAASEDGAIYRYSQTSNGILNIYKGHEAAVTCIHILEMSANRWNLYSGSLDGTFRCYDITTGAQERQPADVGSPVQCMDQAWGVIFVGTKSGHISRYNIKSGSIKGDRLEFSDKSVLALKASSEGPRRVLIVASRNQPITIRDALTGLFLRTICGYKSHTVYSLMRERNLVYCGTSSTSIPVFDFTNGEQVTQYNAGVGIVCMRLYRQILFAGCYDGNIYVFDTKETRLIVSIPGPGNMLLSMEVIGDEIIAGSKDRQLHSWRMPRQVRALLSERA